MDIAQIESRKSRTESWIQRQHDLIAQLDTVEDGEAIVELLSGLFRTTALLTIASILHKAIKEEELLKMSSLTALFSTSDGTAIVPLRDAVLLHPLTPPSLLFQHAFSSQYKIVARNPMFVIYLESEDNSLISFLRYFYVYSSDFYIQLSTWMSMNTSNSKLLDLFSEELFKSGAPPEVCTIPRISKKSRSSENFSDADEKRWGKDLVVWMKIANTHRVSINNSKWQLLASKVFEFLSGRSSINYKTLRDSRTTGLTYGLLNTHFFIPLRSVADIFAYLEFAKKVFAISGRQVPEHILSTIMDQE